MKFRSTKYTGVRAVISSEKKHRGKADVCYYIRWKQHGKLQQEKIGWTSEGYTAAYAAQVRSERIQTGRHGAPVGNKAPTLNTCWGEYDTRHLTGRACRATDEGWYRVHIKPRFGSMRVSALTPALLEKFRDDLAAVLAPQTVKHILALIRRIFNRCRTWGLVSGENPVSRIELPTVRNERYRFLSRGEADMLLEELKRRSMQTYRMAAFGLYTGRRFSEIAALTWGRVDLKHKTLRVTDGKTGDSGHPLNKRACAVLAELEPGAPGELVFPSRTGGVSARPSRAFARAVEAVGLNSGVDDPRGKVVYHTLRHTFASWLVMKGAPLYAVAKLLDHSTTKTTQRYAHLAPEHTRATAELLDD